MNPPDSLHLDEHLARLLAAYDQGIGDGDSKASTLDVPMFPLGSSTSPNDAEQLTQSMPGALNEGSLGDLFPNQAGANGFPNAEPGHPLPQHNGPPHRIGRFELRRQLGKGGCGIVFLAYDPKLKREVALKIPRPEMLLNSDARRRLLREAHAAAEFDHPNLVPVYETGEIGPVCFIATAFCPGQTLAEWIYRQSFPVPVRQAARLVAQLAEAVQHAHDRGVLHRDLKPNNVIIQETKMDPADQGPPPGSCPLRGEHYVPRVVDFGLAKLAERGPAETVTRQVLGTPKYMAPEQAQARHEDIGPRVDVYSLGVILYELLTGRAPYEGTTDVDVLRQSIEGRLTPPRNVRADVPRDLEAICLKAMARTPTKRYRTAIDLSDDLRRYLDGRPTLARPLNRFGRSARWLRRNDQAVALAVVTTIAFILLANLAFHVLQSRQLRDKARAEQDGRAQLDRQRDYARHVRDAFLSWRAGDAQQMADSLSYARSSLVAISDPDFTWGYLSQLGRMERLSTRCPAGAATALAVAPNDACVATGHPDGTLTLWNRRTGTAIGSAKAHDRGVTHLAFLNGGTTLVSAGRDHSIRTWNVPSAGMLTPGEAIRGPASTVTALAASPTKSLVYVGFASGECWGCELPGNRAAQTWAVTDREPVLALAVTADGKTLATVGQTGSVRLWNAESRQQIGEVRGAAGSPALAFVPQGPHGWLLAATGQEDGAVRLFDPQGREVRSLPGHSGPIVALTASPDGSTVASGGTDAGLCVWDVQTGSTRALLRGHEGTVNGVVYAPDGQSLMSTSEDGLFKVWDLTADPKGQLIRGLPAGVSGVAVHPSGQSFAAGYADGSVEIYSRRNGPPRRLSGRGRGPIVSLRCPETGPPVGVELAGRSAIVWEFGENPRPVFRAEAGAGSTATAVDLSASADQLAVGDDRGRVTLWSLASRVPIGEFGTEFAAPVQHLCLSDDGKWVATQTTGHAIGVWEVKDSKRKYRVQGHGDGLWLVRFLPGGRRLVTTGRGSSIKIWDVTTGREDLALLGHVGRVTGLTVSPDGVTLVSGSASGEVKLWDLRTGLELVGLRRHAGAVTATEFAGTGRVLVTGGTAPGGRGELALWDAPAATDVAAP